MPTTVELFWSSVMTLLAIETVGTEPSADLDTFDQAGFVRRAGSTRKTANIGGSRVLDCDVEYPRGQYAETIMTWRKQGREVPIFIQFNGYLPHVDQSYQGRIRLVEQASIEISDIRTSDEGWYGCDIVLVDTKEESKGLPNASWIYLTVNSPPVLGEVSPSFLIQKEGETIDLSCEASATPEPIITWHKDGKEVVASDRVVVKDNRIQLNKLQRTDGGVYACTFRNIVGQVGHTIKLVIEEEGWISSGNSYIMVPPKNTTALEGTRVKLDCQAESYPNNISYRWFKNEVDVQNVPGLMPRSGIYADGGFVITSVAKEDMGWYRCRPTNGLGLAPEAQAFLNVTYLPVVQAMSGRIYLPRGMLGRIECPVEANPPATRIVWSVNEQVIDPERTSRIRVNKFGALVLRSVEKEDEGRYACRPYSPLGSGQTSLPVQVYVRDPPFFSLLPNPVYQRQQAQSVTLTCAAEGEPTPTIIWKKASGSFPPTTKTLTDGGNLTIVQLRVEDEGSYECIASNLVTTIIATTFIIIELTLRHAPYNVTVETTSVSAKVSWMPAYDAGYAQHYVLWYRVQGSVKDDWQTLRVVPEEAVSITVYNLFSDTLYQFMVLSRSRLGDEHFSKLVSASTKRLSYSISDESATGKSPSPGKRKNSTPPSPPVNITVQQLQNSLRIGWRPPVSSPVPVLSYTIEYRTVGHWVPLTSDGIPINDTSYEWRTASRGAIYYFRIISNGRTSASTPSEVVSISTGSGSPYYDRRSVSNATIGAIVAGLFLLLVTVIIIMLLARHRLKLKKRELAIRYGNVKYFGPNQVGASRNHGSNEGNHTTSCDIVADNDLTPVAGNHVTTSENTGQHVKETPI